MIGQNLQRGQKIRLTVFGINAPVNATPGNSIFLRTDGKLDFYE